MMTSTRSDDDLKRELHAILFSVAKVMIIEELAKVVKETDLERVKNLLSQIRVELDAQQSPVMLLQDGDRYKLTVRSQFMTVVQKVVKQTELPKSVTETLAVIAYKTPVLQSDVIKIRTNKAYNHLDLLEEQEYITREKKGRTKLIKLTPKFYDYFEISPEELQKKFATLDVKETGEQQTKLRQEHPPVAPYGTPTKENEEHVEVYGTAVPLEESDSGDSLPPTDDTNTEERDGRKPPEQQSVVEEPTTLFEESPAEATPTELSPTEERAETIPAQQENTVLTTTPRQNDPTQRRDQASDSIHESDREEDTYEPPRVKGGFKEFTKKEKKEIKKETEEILQEDDEE